MRLTPMRFKEFTWPHNPEVYTVEYRRRLAVHRVPFGPCVLQDLGSVYRVLRGRGVFAGSEAYQQFQALASVFRQEGPGLLVHPVWQTANAWFVELSVRQEPTEDYVRYGFTFWECYDGYRRGLAEVGGDPAEAGNKPPLHRPQGDRHAGVPLRPGKWQNLRRTAVRTAVRGVFCLFHASLPKNTGCGKTASYLFQYITGKAVFPSFPYFFCFGIWIHCPEYPGGLFRPSDSRWKRRPQTALRKTLNLKKKVCIFP